MTTSLTGTPKARKLWLAALGELQLQMTRPSFATWLKDTQGTAVSDSELVVGVPDTFVAEMLERRMHSLISETVARVNGRPIEVRYSVTADGETWTSNGRRPHPETGPPTPPDPDPARREPAAAPPSHRAIPLNARYNFDAFVVGKSNELAHAAALAVAERPGVLYNPLTIYSGVGLGKTHLLHAIGHRARSLGRSPTYVTTEEFTNEYIRAIREGRTEEFRDRYRSSDLLMLDDIQFLIGKEQTQEGFFHTFNSLHTANKQIVITSDRPVSSLGLLEDRIRSRLAGGLVADIQPPDLETRIAIILTKIEQSGRNIGPDIASFLAERIHTNIRELEGCFNRVLAYADLTRRQITRELVSNIIADSLTTAKRRAAPPETIVDAVADYFSLDTDAIRGPRGRKNVALARQVAMYIIKEETNLGPTAIGRALGGKDHSTVIKNCAKVADMLDSDPTLRRDVHNIREAIAGA